MTRLLVLRPEPGSTATINRARRLGLEALAMPLFKIEPTVWRAPPASAFNGLLLTSANALRHGGPQLEQLRGLPVFAVGEATAAAACNAGFIVAATGDGGADRLLRSLDPELKLLHLCGVDRKPVDARQQITSVPVYHARANKIETGELGDGVALIHSARAAARFAQLVEPRARGSICIAAISGEALGMAGAGWAAAEAADKPNDQALLVLAARLCNKTGAQ